MKEPEPNLYTIEDLYFPDLKTVTDLVVEEGTWNNWDRSFLTLEETVTEGEKNEYVN